MKSRFIMFRRSGVYYSEDTVTRKQHSLRTKDESEAMTLLNAKNESFRQPVLNRQIARTYPERFAQEALGHNSKAIHHAYSKNAQVIIPALEDYEKKLAAVTAVILSMPNAVAA